MKISAILFLKPTAEGGRQNPIFTGYRPSFYWGLDKQSDCEITVKEQISIMPGTEGMVEIKPLHPNKLVGIKEGDSFSIREGQKEVAKGKILEVLAMTFKIGDLVLYNQQEAEILEIKKVFSVEKVKIKILKSNQIIDTKLDLLEEANEIVSSAKISFLAIAAKINSEVSNQTLLAPFESNVIPLPHQILALEKVMSGQYLRFLIADEVGMGKTIETGLVLKELKLRNIVKRVLIIVPKSAMLQWQQEMKKHFNESFHIYDTEYINTLSRTFARLDADNEINIFTQHNQLIVSMDALKPIESRQGWNKQKVEEHNRYRIESVLDADFDLLIIDECHKVGGSSQLVGRYQMADTLCNAIPNVLLLSATPHRGKSDHFRRILQLLDADAFSGEGMPKISELEPYVVRTEKRQAIDYNGKPLFNKRNTQKVIVYYNDSEHSKQRKLYESVTKYVTEGFNLAQQTKDNSYGFVMILFQRMMSSSTQAILDAMQKRANRLENEKQDVTKENLMQNWEELGFEGQMELDFEEKIFTYVEETQAKYETELSVLKALIREAKDCLNTEIDAKVAFLLEKLTELKRAENNPDLKFLLFTEFKSTQFMLKKILEERGGYLCEAINGSMDFDQRIDALKKFKEKAQILVSTDAAGESLNMQFAHVVINYDMPWNPMVVEQRIGRVDRIGQTYEVIAINLLLDNSIDKRVYEVIETKLNQIMDELGIDKTSDVLDSTLERESISKLYLTSLLNPAKFEQESNTWLEDIKAKLKEYQSTEGALPTLNSKDIKVESVDAIMHSPLPKWLEILSKNYLESKGILYHLGNEEIKFELPAFKENLYTFNIKESVNNPIPEPLSLQHEIIQTMLSEAIPFTESHLIPFIIIKQGTSSAGYWSLWHLTVKNEFDSQEVVQPIFISEEGNSYPAYAQDVWKKIIQERSIFDCLGVLTLDESKSIFNELSQQADTFLQSKYEEMENAIQVNTQRIKTNKEKAFAFQEKQLQRIGIENIKKSRLQKLDKEKENWTRTFDNAKEIIPSLTPLLILKITNG